MNILNVFEYSYTGDELMLKHPSVISDHFRKLNLTAIYFLVKQLNLLLVEESLKKLQSSGSVEGFTFEKGPAMNRLVIVWAAPGDGVKSAIINQVSGDCIPDLQRPAVTISFTFLTAY